MVITKINENNGKTNTSQELLNRLTMAFSNKHKEVQIVLAPMLSHLPYLDNLITDISTRIEPTNTGRTDKENDELQAYLKLVNELCSILSFSHFPCPFRV